MTVSTEHTANTSHVSCRQWLQLRGALMLTATVSLGSAIGCAGSGESLGDDISDTNQAATDDPIRAALRNGAFSTPERLGGFCTHGAGVFLSAANNTAKLTLYVVAPAESVTFRRPALYVTTQEGDHFATETAEFEDVTLEAGQSRVFQKEAEGTLVEVFADFASE